MAQNQKAQEPAVGEGSPGKRIKSAWRAEGRSGSLREFARSYGEGPLAGLIELWFESKRPGGPKEQREARAARSAGAGNGDRPRRHE